MVVLAKDNQLKLGDYRLNDLLNEGKEGKDWERKQTNVLGVFLLKLPAFRGRPACIAIDALGRGVVDLIADKQPLANDSVTSQAAFKPMLYR